MNQPLVLTDPSGLSWLSKVFSNIGHFVSKYWRAIVAVVAAVVSFGVLLPYCVAFAGSAIAGAMIAGAIAGAIAGGITGGWKGALVGALSGAMFGGISAEFGSTWNAGRVALNGVAGGISCEVAGGKFWQGAALGLGLSALQWGASSMREEMIAQSKLDPRNASGVSDGVSGDHFKLAGSRIEESMPETALGRTLHKLFSWVPKFKHVLFGGEQGQQGYFADHAYAPGSWEDHLLENYAGPHDWLNSNWYYTNTGNWVRMGSIAHILSSLQEAVTIAPATVLVGAQAAPGLAFVKEEH